MSSPNHAPHELFERQREYFATGGSKNLDARVAGLRALSRELEARTDEALEALQADLGKPALEAWLSEIHFIRAEIRHCVRKLARWNKPAKARTPFYFWPARSSVRWEPLGQVLIAAPWNYPIQLALSPLVSAVAAGNCAVVKPSELSPASSRFLARLIGAVFDSDHVTVVEGGSEVGSALLELPFQLFCYTGGERVGRLYAQAAARHLAPAILELGGKCPCVIDEDVNLDLAVERIVNGKFFNAGQTCIAPDFVLVPDSLHEPFIKKAEAEINRCFGETRSKDLTRIVNAAHYERLQAMIPPECIAIGDDDQGDRYLAPRLLPKANWDSKAMQEEIFGPILPVIPYQNLQQALERLRAHPSPLALYVFSRNRGTQERVAAAVPSGAVCFNDVMKTATNHFLPLGGVGPSGMGRYRGEAGFRSFSNQRSMTRRWLRKDPFLVKPPYGDQLAKLRKLLKS